MELEGTLHCTHVLFGFIKYAMVSDEKTGKLDAKDTKCLFFGYCEGITTHRLMYLKINEIIKSRDVAFVEDRTSIWDFKIRPSKKDDTLIVVGVDECFELPLFYFKHTLFLHRERTNYNCFIPGLVELTHMVKLCYVQEVDAYFIVSTSCI